MVCMLLLLLLLQGFYVFIRALQLLRSHNEGVVLVGLGGASGSGKTAFSEKVRRQGAAAATTATETAGFGKGVGSF
jgi:hypothetical protein